MKSDLLINWGPQPSVSANKPAMGMTWVYHYETQVKVTLGSALTGIYHLTSVVVAAVKICFAHQAEH